MGNDTTPSSASTTAMGLRVLKLSGVSEIYTDTFPTAFGKMSHFIIYSLSTVMSHDTFESCVCEKKHDVNKNSVIVVTIPKQRYLFLIYTLCLYISNFSYQMSVIRCQLSDVSYQMSDVS